MPPALMHKFKYMIFSPCLLVVIIAIALVTAFPQAAARHRAEQSNKTVQLLLPYGELLEKVQLQGGGAFTAEEALRAFAEAGIGGLLFREQSVLDLQNLGELRSFEGAELLAAYRGGRAGGWVTDLGGSGELLPGRFYLEIYEKDTWQRALYYLSHKYKNVAVHREAAGAGHPGVLSLPGNALRWEHEGLGFPTAAVEAAAAQGFTIYLQFAFWPGANAESIAAMLQPLRELPSVGGFLFRDAMLPGVPGSTARMAAELKELAVPLVTIEFFDRQAPNLNRLARSLEDKELLRLHAITQKEMEELSLQRITARFSLAAAERNNRLLLLRFGNGALLGTPWLEYNRHVYETVGEKIHASGFTLGPPLPYTALPFSRISVLLLGAGVLAAAVLLLRRLLVPPAPALAAGTAALLLLAALLAAGGKIGGFDSIELTRKGLALGAALVFPTLGVLTARSYLGGRAARTLGGALCAFALSSAVSLVGGFLLAALLSDLLYMVKLDQFSGVKAALTLPLFFLLLYYAFAGQAEEEIAQERLPDSLPVLWKRFCKFLGQPVVVGTVLAALVLAALAYIYISRAGNESLFVSDTELRLRLLLNDFLPVRPRTKEFLIGHPLMLLALYFGIRFRGGPVLLALGAIGQVSLVNSFAHLHTPLMVTLSRTLWGLGLGLLIGLVLLVLLSAIGRNNRAAAAVKGTPPDRETAEL
ncbi:MAG: DUF5693 family protein [Bacillota bacterium]